ncbi:hypothetical protein RI129_007078 [Pyrocoelia pectoralis]|uniref:Uncharacterized protein n=1 Tax=Pyrocoelia pectoralis TaxID=417401 RepID=A0AAN7VDE5_9COLE
MKVLYVYLLLCILSINAQRRLGKQDSSDLEQTSQKTIRSRGRTRFAVTPEFEQVSEDYELVKKSQIPDAPRRKPDRSHVPERKPSRPVAQEPLFNRRSYEVREIVDDIPRENPPRLKKKPHVVTETKFEAANVAPKELFTPTPLPANDISVSKSDEPVALLSVSTEKSTEASVEQTSAAIPELKRNKPTEPSEIRRFHPRARNTPPKSEGPPTIKSRSKPVQKQTTTVATPPQRSNYRVNRRRPEPTAEASHDSLRTKGPSVFSAESAAEFPNRSRTGRKVVMNGNEDVTENTVVLRRRPAERRRPKTIDAVTNAPKEETISEEPPRVQQQRVVTENIVKIIDNGQASTEPHYAPRRIESRRSRFSTTTSAPSTEKATPRSPRRGPTPRTENVEETTSRNQRNRQRTKVPNDTVVTIPTRAYFSRRRQSDTIDDIDAASTKQTEVKIKIDSPPEVQPPNVKVSLQRTVSVETKPGRIIRKRLHHVKKTSTKSNEIIEPTPNTDIVDAPRKFDLLNTRQQDEHGPRPSQKVVRKNSRNSAKGDGLSSSQESIDESDNYPAPFKAAIIQAKKKKHGLLGSRTKNANEASVTKTAETTTVTSSISSTSLKSSFPYPDVVTSTTLKKDEETSTSRTFRYPRPRFSLTTKQPKNPDNEREFRKYSSYKSKYSKPIDNESTSTSTTQKYHARYKAKTQNDIDVTVPPKPLIKIRNYVPKPPKGIYSSRRSASTEEKPIKIETTSLSTKVPPVGLSARNRFSARYRNDILPKSAVHRASTSVPSYIATVPTVTPSTSTIKIEDTVQGLEVISFYDPVSNTVHSANLVNGDLVSPTSVTDNSTSQSTERTLTFIERIINSITAISTTASPDSTTASTTDGQTTKTSAILNLVSKRSKDVSLDSTVLTNLQNSTTERPTTIIEQILSSLSVIRADSATIDSNQVGTDSNFVSTQTSAPPLEIVGTTPLSINNSSSSDDTTFVSTTSVSSTAPYTDITNTVVPLDELNTIPTRTASIKPRILNPNSATEEVLTSTTEQEAITASPLVVVTPRANFQINSESSTTDDTNTEMLFTSAIEEETENPQISQIVSAVSKIIASTLEPSTSPSTTIQESSQTTPTIAVSSENFQLNSITTDQSTESPNPIVTDSDVNIGISANSGSTTDFQSSPSIVMSNVPTSPIMTAQSSASAIQTVTDPTPTRESSSDPNTSNTPVAETQMTSSTEMLIGSTTSSSASIVDTVPSSYLVSSPIVTDTSTVLSTMESITPLDNTMQIASHEPTSSRTTDTIVTETSNAPTQTATGPYPTREHTNSVVASTTPSATTVNDEKSITIPQSSATTISTLARFTVTGPYPNSAPSDITQSTPEQSTVSFTDSSIPSSQAHVDSSTPSTLIQSTVSSSQFPYPGTQADTSIFPGTESTTTSSSIPSSTSAPTDATITMASTESTISSSQFSYPAAKTASIIMGSTEAAISSAQFPYPEAKTDTSIFPGTESTLTSPTSSSISSSTATVEDATITMTSAQPITSPQFPYPGLKMESTLTTSTTAFSTPLDTTMIQSDNSLSTSFSQVPYVATDGTSTSPPAPSDNTIMTTLAQSTIAPSLFTYVAARTDDDFIAQSSTISEVLVTSYTTPSTTTLATTTTSEHKSDPMTLEDSSTVPSISNFEVSPDRVSIYSPNDISSTFLPEESASTTISISGSVLTTASATPSTTTTSKPYPNTEPSTTSTTTTNTLDVSSNTIDTNSANDKTDITNLINQLSLTTNAVESSTTTTTKQVTTQGSREEKRLRFELMSPTNDISEPPEKDYYIFAVLQNNTILRKRPSRFPNKNTPFLIYGVLPNNTLIQKFPNGTVVPMEPVIQVNGFDTRDYPQTAPELISNQVTSNEEIQRNNKAVTIENSNNVEVNELSASTSATPPPLPTIVQLLGGKTVSEFNNIVNQTKDEQMGKVQTLDVDPLLEGRATKTDAPSSSTEISSSSTTTTTTTFPFTSAPQTTVTASSTSTSERTTTTDTLTTVGVPSSDPENDIEANALGISIPSDTSETVTPSPPVTLLDLLTKATTIPTPTIASIKDLKVDESKLTDQQRQDWEILKALEKEQQAILKQLSFLTRLNLSGTNSANVDSLASRVVAQAVGNTVSPTLVPTDNRQAKQLTDPGVEKIVNEVNTNGFNTVTPTSPIVSSTYGKTNDALLASLLKEYGVGPTTPKGFSDAFSKALLTTTRPPTKKPTTQAPGPIMQGLNWLLNTLSPQPSPKPKPKPKPTVSKQIKLTEATTKLPESNLKNAVITDRQLEFLIQQLEAIQKDPKKAKNLDIEALRKLQTMSRTVAEVTSETPPPTTTSSPDENELKPVIINRANLGQSSTPLPLSVTNNIEDNVKTSKPTTSTVTESRVPPVKLNRVPGVPDESPRIRGQLVNYAINITKAISSFLGTALQGAASTFQSLIGSVSRTDGNYGNSNSSKRPG